MTMTGRSAILFTGILVMLLNHSSFAQDTRTIRTHSITPASAPVQVTNYETVVQIFDDGFFIRAFLEETVTLKNVSPDRITAVEIGTVYAGAFGEVIDMVFETVITEMDGQASHTETFKFPVYYAEPIYTAVAYPSQVRFEPADDPGKVTVWQADSSDVATQLQKLINDFSVTKRTE